MSTALTDAQVSATVTFMQYLPTLDERRYVLAYLSYWLGQSRLPDYESFDLDRRRAQLVRNALHALQDALRPASAS